MCRRTLKRREDILLYVVMCIPAALGPLSALQLLLSTAHTQCKILLQLFKNLGVSPTPKYARK